MTEWVRDRNALLTVFKLRCLQVGDQMEFDRIDGNIGSPPTAITLTDAQMVQRIYAYYDNPEFASMPWRVTAWRRP
jgi:hypothetical protein